jgi:hypothetical protein
MEPRAMTIITDEHKREYLDAHAQATTAIDRLNKLFADTDRKYRAQLVIKQPEPELDEIDDDVDQEADALNPYRGMDPIGRERAESEDESGEL